MGWCSSFPGHHSGARDFHTALEAPLAGGWATAGRADRGVYDYVHATVDREVEVTQAIKTMRVRPQTRSRLRDLAEHEGRSVPDLLDELVEREEDRRMLAQSVAAMEQLHGDPARWNEWKKETALWEATLLDGLQDLR